MLAKHIPDKQGLTQSNFLTDPQAQFDFLQSNPLFQMGLDNANQQTLGMAASRGRLSAGDTLQQLNNNALQVASPLIQDQKNSIGSLLNYGLTTAGNQGNLLTGQGAVAAGGITNSAAAQAGGMIGEANARGQRAQNIFGLAGQGAASIFGGGGGGGGGGAGNAAMLASIFSDPKLKTNIKKISEKNGFNIYSWAWNKTAHKLGLYGFSSGVMADEVAKVMPEAIGERDGFMTVNYSMIGV